MLTEEELSDFWQGELDRFVPDPVHNLEDAFGYVSCPICHALAKVPFDYSRFLPVRWREEPVLREIVSVAGGLCNRHTWSMADMQSDIAIARVYRDVLAWLRANGPATEGMCPVCRLMAAAERRLLDAFVEYFASPQRRQQYPRLFGLCYRHLGCVLSRELEDGLRRMLLETAAASADALVTYMDGFISKDSVEGRWTRTHDENRAPRRALVKAAGDAGA